jgi:hypothetical protein
MGKKSRKYIARVVVTGSLFAALTGSAIYGVFQRHNSQIESLREEIRKEELRQELLDIHYGIEFGPESNVVISAGFSDYLGESPGSSVFSSPLAETVAYSPKGTNETYILSGEKVFALVEER